LWRSLERLSYPSIDGVVDDRDIGDGNFVSAHYSQEISEAEATLRYFQIAGDNPKSTEQSVTIDRQIADLLAKQKMRGESFCIERVAKAVKLSRPSTHERYKLRCARILKALHRDCPTRFDDKGCPVRIEKGTGRSWGKAVPEILIVP
jgi:hypothetical protein